MGRRWFDWAFKLEAVRLVWERAVSAAQAARDLDLHENVLRKWVKEFAADPQHAFPGQGQMKPEQLEIERLRREVTKLKAERQPLGLALVQNGRRGLFMRTTDLVQRLQVARRDLGLEAAITKLDKYQLLILDDIAYVTKDQAETGVCSS